MTGLAKIAWIIIPLCLGWSLAQVGVGPRPAHAAAPRDAIKSLPSFTHTSNFRIFESDGPEEPTYVDDYRGDWYIDWLPPKIRLGGSATARFKLHYRLTMSDVLDRIKKTSSDSRQDWHEYFLRVDSANGITADFNLVQTDTFSNPRTWSSQQVKTTNLRWTAPGLPIVSFGERATMTTVQTDSLLTSTSESTTSTYSAEYKRDRGAFGQHYKATAQRTRSRNILGGTGTNRNTNRFEGYRQLILGGMGTLQLSYYLNHIEKDSITGLGFDTESASRYGLQWWGEVSSFPLRYDFIYQSLTNDFSNEPGNEQTEYRLNLKFRPPVPQGKAASLDLTQSLTEDDHPTSQTSKETRKSTWSFTANPRTSGFLVYETKTSVNRIEEVVTEEIETVSGDLRYQIPGNRGSLAGRFSEGSTQSTAVGGLIMTSNLNISNNLKLGDSAEITFTLDHFRTDSVREISSVSNDKLESWVNYNIKGNLGGKRNLSLNTTWKQILNTQSTGQRINTQRIDLHLAYDTANNWKYQFDTKDTFDTSKSGPSLLSYESVNDIRFLVSYTF